MMICINQTDDFMFVGGLGRNWRHDEVSVILDIQFVMGLLRIGT